MALAQRIKERWRLHGLEHSTTATIEDVHDFASKNRILLPDDLATYFLQVNGMPDDVWDEEMLHFHPLAHVSTLDEPVRIGQELYSSAISTNFRPGSLFVIADYLIGSHFYAIHLTAQATSNNPVLWILPPECYVMGASFTDFMERYLSDPGSIVFPSALL